MERSGCCLSIPKLQLGGADLNCSPSFLPNVVIARDAAAAIFGNLYILRIALALITVPSVRVRHDAEFFLGAGGSAVGRETACGITQGKKKIWHSVDANMVAAAHTGMRKAQGGCTGEAKQLGASLQHIHTFYSLARRAIAG